MEIGNREWDRLTGKGGEKKPESAKELHYSLTKTVDLNKDAKEVEKLRDELAQKVFDNHLKELSVSERILEVKKQIAAAEKRAIGFEFGEGDDKKALQEKLEAEKLRSQLHSLEKEEYREENKARAHHRYQTPEVSSLQRIGGYISPGELKAQQSALNAEGHLLQIRKGIDYLVRNASRTKY
jgi:hypothetical protein